MRKIFKKALFSGVILLTFFSCAFADDAQMKESLTHIILQLQALKPLISEAQKAQPQNPRITLHFDSWVDAKGIHHNGLRQDIDLIQKGLIDAVNRQDIEPRHYDPINNDFVGTP